MEKLFMKNGLLSMKLGKDDFILDPVNSSLLTRQLSLLPIHNQEPLTKKKGGGSNNSHFARDGGFPAPHQLVCSFQGPALVECHTPCIQLLHSTRSGFIPARERIPALHMQGRMHFLTRGRIGPLFVRWSITSFACSDRY